MSRTLLTTSLFAGILSLGCPTFVHTQESVRVREKERAGDDALRQRVVELAICLDTSGSMDGLIDAARQKLWSIVNDLALATPAPKLRVALITYGNTGHPAENGWVHVQTGFTEDLDKVSELLFGLTTNGGDEYVGRVVQTAVQELDWNLSDDALKIIFVAGNESADQDPKASFRDQCRAAIARGIMVNPIYCVYGSDAPDVASGWREIASLADGQYAAIDQQNGTVVIETPYDAALSMLSSAVNATYIPFGAQGQAGWANQMRQDANAQTLNTEAAAQRAQTKGGAMYHCSWDLVDACSRQEIKLAEVKDEDLPVNMRAMTAGQRQAYLDEMQTARAAIQKQITDLTTQRQAWVTEWQKRQAVDESRSFDFAVRNIVREQAAARGFSFKSDAAEPKTEPGEPMKPVDLGSAHLFVKIAGRWIDTVHANEFMQLERDGKAGEIEPIERGTPEYDAVLKQLPQTHQAAATALDAEAVVRVGETWHRLAPAAKQQDEAATTAGRVAAIQPTSTSTDIRMSTDIADPAARADVEKRFVAVDGVWVDKRLADQYRADPRHAQREYGMGYPVMAIYLDPAFETALRTLDAEYAAVIRKAFAHVSGNVIMIAIVDGKPVAFVDLRC